MILLDGEYYTEEVREDEVRWAMHLAVLSLQGAANVQDWDAYTNKVAQGTMHILGTYNMIKNELDI